MEYLRGLSPGDIACGFAEGVADGILKGVIA